MANKKGLGWEKKRKRFRKDFPLYLDLFVVRRLKRSSKDKVSRLFTRNHEEYCFNYCWDFLGSGRGWLIAEIFFLTNLVARTPISIYATKNFESLDRSKSTII